MPNPVQMIREDHDRMRQLFREFDLASGAEQQKPLVDKALIDLEAHARVEEQILYPAARELIGDHMLVDVAEEEHHGAKAYIMELARMEPDDSHYAAKFKVLSEVVEHHMQEEESEMLPKLEQHADPARLQAVGEEMVQRWPEFRDEATQMVEGGLVENVKTAFGQLKQASGGSPS
jgi:hypothetical protein